MFKTTNYFNELRYASAEEAANFNATASVIRIYEAAFARNPDAEGLNFWVAELALGASLQVIAEQFIHSPEFLARNPSAAGGDRQAFLTELYQNVMGRAPDDDGLSYWMQSGDSFPKILAYFADSPEFQLRTEDAITQLIGSLASGQGPDPSISLLSNQNALSGTVTDGKIAGATVGIDVDGNGVIDANEPTVTTDALGNFTFPKGSPAGPLIATGGTDISTGLAFKGQMEAPSGSKAVTPLTTMIKKLADLDPSKTKTSAQKATEAQEQLKVLLGIEDIGADITQIDFVTEATEGDPDGSSDGLSDAQATHLYALSVQILTIVSQGGALLAGADGTIDETSAADTLFAALAQQMQALPQGTNLTFAQAGTSFTEEVIKEAARKSGSGTAEAVAEKLAKDAAALANAANIEIGKSIASLDPNANGEQSKDTLIQIIKTQKALETSATQAVKTAAGNANPEGSLAGLVEEFINPGSGGFSNPDLIDQQTVGDVDGDGLSDAPQAGQQPAESPSQSSGSTSPPPQNQAPSLTLKNLATTGFIDIFPITTKTKVAEIVIGDDGLGSNQVSLSGDDQALFEIAGDFLYLKAGAALNAKTNPALDVTVTVRDATIPSSNGDVKSLSIPVQGVAAPNLQLTPLGPVPEDGSTGLVANAELLGRLNTNYTFGLRGPDASLLELQDTGSLYEKFVTLKSGAKLDYETNRDLDFEVFVTHDNQLPNHPDIVPVVAKVPLKDINEAPTFGTFLNPITELAETASPIITPPVAMFKIADDALGLNEISLSGKDAQLFELRNVAGNDWDVILKHDASLDFETNPVLDVSIDVDDKALGTGVDVSKSISIKVKDANKQPVLKVTQTAVQLSEGTDTSSRIKLADIEIIDDISGSNTLSLKGSDANLMELIGKELFLKAGSTLNHKTNPTLDVTVEVDDATLGSGPEDSKTLSFPIADVDDPPELTPRSLVFTVYDSEVTEQLVAYIDVVDDNLPSQPYSFSLSGADKDLFSLKDNGGSSNKKLVIKPGAALNGKTKSKLDVSVSVDDPTLGSGIDHTLALKVTVFDSVGAAPDLSLQGVPKPPNNTIGPPAVAPVDEGTERYGFSVILNDDLIPRSAYNLSLSGPDKDLFDIVYTQPSSFFTPSNAGPFQDTIFIGQKKNAVIDFETNPNIDFTLSIDDPNLGTGVDNFLKFSVPVTDVNEPPVIDLNGKKSLVVEIDEDADTSKRIELATINVKDDALGSVDFAINGANANVFEIDRSTNKVYLKAGTKIDAETPSLATLITYIDGFDPSLLANGGGVSGTDITVNIKDVNEAPIVDVSKSNLSVTGVNTKTINGKVFAEDPEGISVGYRVDQADEPTNGSVTHDGVGNFIYTPNSKFVGQDSFTISIYDNAGLTTKQKIDVTVTQGNHPPVVLINGQVNATGNVTENSPNFSGFKVADITVTDDGLGSQTLSLGGADKDLFEIRPGIPQSLWVKPGKLFDFEQKNSFVVEVLADDPTIGTGPDSKATFTLDVTNVNEAPTFKLTGTGFTQAPGVYTFKLQETDAVTVNRIALAKIEITDDGTGQNDVSVENVDTLKPFEVIGDTLYLKKGILLDADQSPLSAAILRLDDKSIGGQHEDFFAVNLVLENVNEAPSLGPFSKFSTTTEEDQDAHGHFNVVDPDGDTVFVITETPGKEPAHGSIVITKQFPGAYQYTYTPDKDFNGTDTFSIRIADRPNGDPTQTFLDQQIIVTVQAKNDAPRANPSASDILTGTVAQGLADPSGMFQFTDPDTMFATENAGGPTLAVVTNTTASNVGVLSVHVSDGTSGTTSDQVGEISWSFDDSSVNYSALNYINGLVTQSYDIALPDSGTNHVIGSVSITLFEA